MIENITLSRFFEEVLKTEVEVCGEEHDWVYDDSCEINGAIFAMPSKDLPMYFENNTDNLGSRRYFEAVYVVNGRPIYSFATSSYQDYIGLYKDEELMFKAWIIAQLKVNERKTEE